METGILHYSAPPVVGGVEAVILAHAHQFSLHHLPLTLIAGRGDPDLFDPDLSFVSIPEIDSNHPEILAAAAKLDEGILAPEFEPLSLRLAELLEPHVSRLDNLIVHNVLTKHFNLPLTAALYRMLDDGRLKRIVAWCHDLSWTSPRSRTKVFERYPWNLLKTPHKGVQYVTISLLRQKEMVETFGLPAEQIRVVNNGVDAMSLLALSEEGSQLIERLGLWDAELILLMPVRVTRAKNIEYALDFVAALKDLGCKAKLVLTGPPDPHDDTSMTYYQELLNLRRKLDVESEMRFVFESGPVAGEGYTIQQGVVSELYRFCDVMFMPSHHEGFGMPVLEAGLAGMPVISSGVPAALEIALEDAFVFSLHTDPERLAVDVLTWVEDSFPLHLRSRVRREYTWKAIFERDLLPLLAPSAPLRPGLEAEPA